MGECNRAIVGELHEMARTGDTASRMLRALLRRLAPEEGHPLTLIRYLRRAFHLTLQEASPIAGWAADASSELSDSQLDGLIDPAIRRHQQEWDREPAGQPEARCRDKGY